MATNLSTHERDVVEKNAAARVVSLQPKTALAADASPIARSTQTGIAHALLFAQSLVEVDTHPSAKYKVACMVETNERALNKDDFDNKYSDVIATLQRDEEAIGEGVRTCLKAKYQNMWYEPYVPKMEFRNENGDLRIKIEFCPEKREAGRSWTWRGNPEFTADIRFDIDTGAVGVDARVRVTRVQGLDNDEFDDYPPMDKSVVARLQKFAEKLFAGAQPQEKKMLHDIGQVRQEVAQLAKAVAELRKDSQEQHSAVTGSMDEMRDQLERISAQHTERHSRSRGWSFFRTQANASKN